VEQPRVILRLGMDSAEKLFYTLATFAPEYLSRCNLSSAIQFAIWAVAENASWVGLENGGLILTDWRPGLSVRIHPLAWGKKLACDMAYIAEVLRWVQKACRVERVEALLPMGIPNGVLRWCERAGMHLEGTLARSVCYKGHICDGKMFAFTEAIDE
jgi:hypothetical protein